MQRIHLRIHTLIALSVSTAVIWSASSTEEQRFLTVAFLDVGQGDAIYIESPSGNQMLIDGGPDSTVLRRLGEVMPLGDRSIDVVLATHPDSDHVGGLPDVLQRFSVSYVLDPGKEHTAGAWQATREEIERGESRRYIVRRGMVVDLGGGVYFRVLYPESLPEGDDTNSASVVGMLSYGTSDFLFTGDAYQNVEVALIREEGNQLDSEVLKVGHHGSKTSTAPQFLDVVTPEYAVISAGKNNSYGHPHESVLSTLGGRDIDIRSTAESGTIRFQSDGARVWLLQ